LLMIETGRSISAFEVTGRIFAYRSYYKPMLFSRRVAI
jgi:hypothetical protein